MDIHVFLVCYNESALLPHAIHHYKKYLPSCKITIYDNHSTDNSVDIAKSLGCICIDWDTNNKIDDHKLQSLKNNCWKNVQHGWIIVADMDEFLCATEADLLAEIEQGTSILDVEGINMVGESQTTDLSDINLQDLTKFNYFFWENKKLCFLREKITDMNYMIGAHDARPEGDLKYSSKKYLNKHMSNLGLDYLIKKMFIRYDRSADMRGEGLCRHYTNDINRIKASYNWEINHHHTLDEHTIT